MPIHDRVRLSLGPLVFRVHQGTSPINSTVRMKKREEVGSYSPLLLHSLSDLILHSMSQCALGDIPDPNCIIYYLSMVRDKQLHLRSKSVIAGFQS